MNNENRTEKMIRKKRRRKKNYLLRLIILILVCVGLYFAAHIDYFDVNGIAVAGNDEITDEEIIKLSELKPGMSLFDVHPLMAQHRIKKNLYVESVDVDRKLPNKVVIHITERSGKAQFIMGKKYVVTDNDGRVLEIAKEERKATLVEGIEVKEAKPDKEIEIKENPAYDRSMALIRSMEENDLYFKKLNITKGEVNAYVYDGLMCRGEYRYVMEAIESGALRAVVYDLYQKGIEKGVITVGKNNYCSFTP